MTTPNPTPTPPTTREREAARDTLDKIVEFWEAGRPSTYAPWLEHELIEMSDYIAAALARERREALTEAAQVARNEMCDADDTKDAVDVVYNNACEDCAAAIEQLREE